MAGNTSNNINLKKEELSERLMDLAIGRVFKSLHSKVSDKEKLIMEKIFESGSDEEKEKFMKKYLPNFESAYKDELVKLAEELSQEM